ncbi:MAG: LmbE family protein, partial [Terriglobia bacterium]
VSGILSLSAPAGWSCEPKQIPFTLSKEGEAAAFKFAAVAGKEIRPGREIFEAVATVNGQKISESYRMYSVQDLWKLPLYRKADSEVVAFDYTLPAKLRVAYVMGAGDRVPDALVQMGLAVKLLESEDVAAADLRQYDCIIAGVRAYDVRDDLIANNARLLDYVKQGGVFVVQYNRKEPWNKAQYAPYPAKIASNDHRVTDENAPVTILDPKHPVFNFPNKITPGDFEGWVQERGLYFIQDRDPHFKPLLASGDPGEKPLDGGLLVADYGTGKYVLTSYAWFRQLPEGVPGAIRIFANLISLGRAPVKAKGSAEEARGQQKQ